jgi:uncharacterized protein (DUF1786 family)
MNQSPTTTGQFAVCRRDKCGRWLFLARFGGRTAFTKHLSQAKTFTDPDRAALEIVDEGETVRALGVHYSQQQQEAA